MKVSRDKRIMKTVETMNLMHPTQRRTLEATTEKNPGPKLDFYCLGKGFRFHSRIKAMPLAL